MVEYIEDKTGVMLSIAPDGKMVMTKWKLPVNQNYTLIGWVEDFLRVIEEFGSVRLFLLRLVLGRYGYREMIGMLDYLKEIGWWTPGIGYSLKEMNYHQEGDRLKFTD